MKGAPLLFLLAIGGSILAGPLRLKAQPIEGPLTVQEALRQAENNSPELGRLRARLAAEEGRRLSAFGIHNPQVNYAREAIPNGEGGFGEQRWVIQQSIDSPVETVFRFKQLDAGREALAAEIEAERLRLRERVKGAYLDLVYAEALAGWRRRALDLGESLLQGIGVRIDTGEAAELDRMRAQLDQASARGDAEEANRQQRTACADLYRVIGLQLAPAGCAITPADTFRSGNVSLVRAQVMQPAEAHPVMQQAAASLSAARYNVQRSRGAYFPQLHINYWPQDFGGGYDFHGFEVGFTAPVWFLFNQRSATRVAEAETQQRLWDVQDAALRFESEREKAWTSFVISREALARFENEVNFLAQNTLRLTRRAYELGEIDLLPLLDTQRTYIDIQIRYLDALKAYHRDLIVLERFAETEFVFEE